MEQGHAPRRLRMAPGSHVSNGFSVKRGFHFIIHWYLRAQYSYPPQSYLPTYYLLRFINADGTNKFEIFKITTSNIF